MAELKEKLRADMTSALKSQDKLTLATLRMTLAAIQNEEVAGAAARELSDDEVRRVIAREIRKRKEAATAFAEAGRDAQAQNERDEAAVLDKYLPAQLEDDELNDLVAQAIAQVTGELGEQPGARQMGQVMKAANAKVAGRAEGGRVAAAVKARLSN